MATKNLPQKPLDVNLIQGNSFFSGTSTEAACDIQGHTQLGERLQSLPNSLPMTEGMGLTGILTQHEWLMFLFIVN